ncbi:MAG: amidohydrolase [Acidimicrobiales bacterium]
MSITIVEARSVITMDPGLPRATAVAVRGGRILAVGDSDKIQQDWGPATVNRDYADAIITPGFVEAHSHVLDGAVWAMPYIGYFDRRSPDGTIIPGCTTIDAVIERLQAEEALLGDPAKPLMAWGLDPIYMPGERLVASHLDRVSTTRQVFVFHASGHLATVNTALMVAEGFADGTSTPGVPLGPDGKPNGELQEPAAIGLARTAAIMLRDIIGSPEALERFGQSARVAGITTITELGAVAIDRAQQLETWMRVTDDESFPARTVPFYNPGSNGAEPDAIADMVLGIGSAGSDKLLLGRVKMVLDGSIQGFTARLNQPGYLGDRPNGLWLIAPERFAALFRAFHSRRITVHVHCNGDEAVDLFLDTVEAILWDDPWADHRHTVQHCQLTTPSQYRRMAKLGVNANIFSNHIFYWGDQHRDITVGFDRASKMDACATAGRLGVSYSIHSDASVTPLGHLHTMWCAVNRLTASGTVLGPDERISVADAMAATTINAAYQLQLDDLIGSLEAGKFADMTVLAEDPFEVDPVRLKDIAVLDTILSGVPTSSTVA